MWNSKKPKLSGTAELHCPELRSNCNENGISFALNEGSPFKNWWGGRNSLGISQIPLLMTHHWSRNRSSQFPGASALWTDSFSHLQCSGVGKAWAAILTRLQSIRLQQRRRRKVNVSGDTVLSVGSQQQEEHGQLYIPTLPNLSSIWLSGFISLDVVKSKAEGWI